MDNLKKKKGKNNENRKPQAYAEEAEKPLDGAISDPRFAHLHTDPRFMRVPRHNNKVSIDSRFSSMFHDKHFAASSSAVDKRGRRKKKQDKHDLHRYYHLSDTEDADNADAGYNNNNNKAPAQEEKNLESEKNAEEIAQADDERTETELKEKKNKKNNKKKKNKKNVSDERFLSSEEEPEEESKLEKKKKNADDSAVKTETDKKGKFKALNKKNKKNKSKNVSEERFRLSEGEEELQEESKVGKKKKNKNASDFILDERFRLRDEDISEEESKVGKKKKKNKNASVPVIDDERFRLSDDEEDISEEESKIGKKKKKNKDASALVSDERFRLNEEDISDKEAKVGKKKRKDKNAVKERFGDVGVRDGGEKLQKLKKKGEDRGLDLGDIRGKDGKKNVEVNFDDDDEEMESVFGSGDSEVSGSESSSDEDESNSEVLSSESESDDESFSDEGGYGSEMSAELSKEEVPTLENETRRLAAVNMDWNHVKAVDLLVLMNSFLPKGGQILSVAVYPSEFGKKRMEEEAVRGPSIFHANEDSSEEEEEEDSETLNEKLRQYEKEKLRYYFAVIECDSPATADYLYKACDKVEFERTSNVMDLRFIPDDMEFKESPRDVAREVPATYEAPDYQTRALQHSKVNVSWDEDEPQRVKTLHRKFDSKQVNEMDYKDYLASEDDLSDGSGDDSDDVENVEKKEKLKEKYRSLLMESGHSDEDSEDKTDEKDMEITFNTGLEELGKRISEKKQREEETVWDAYLRRRKEKRKEKRNLSKQSEDDSLYSSEEENTGKRSDDHSDDFFMDEDSIDVTRDKKEKVKSSKVKKSDKKQEEGASKAELELLLADDNGRETGIKGYNLKSFKGKKRGLPEGEDKLPSFDFNDPRFSALFSNHNYAVDPTDPLFKRSEAYSRIIAQRQQKKFVPESDDTKASIEAETNDDLPNTKKRKYEISQLVNSVKRKVGSLNSKI